MEINEKVDPSVQVIIAAWNEEEGIESTIAEFRQHVSSKILVVDGWSTDRTVEIAKNMGADILFQDGKGKGDAIAKAVYCLDSNVDYVVLTDADFTYPADYVPEMIRILEKDPTIGMVCGNRFNGEVDKEALHSLFNVGNRLIAFTHNVLNGIQLADPLTGLRVVRAEILRGWVVKSRGFDIEVELNHLVERKGFGIVEIPIAYRPRLGEKKLKPKHAAIILSRILLESVY